MKKLVWVEGTLLGQQHLQQWDHYHHDRQDFLSRAASPFLWGIKKLIWDEDSIQYGKLIIKQAEVIFPNGWVIKYDSRFELPLSYQLNLEQKNSEEIYLVIPISSYTKGIAGYPNHAGLTGWIGAHQLIFDEEDAEREREVLFAYPNLQLFSSQQDKSLYHSLKIAEIIKKNVNQYSFSENFIPSGVSLDSSYALTAYINFYSELLGAKARLLESRQPQPHTEWRDFLLLQQFTVFIAQLNFLKSCSSLHPLELYKLFIQIITTLSRFNTQPHSDFIIPEYQHHNLTAVFVILDTQLKLLITAIIPSRMSLLTWHRESEWLYTSDHIDSRLFQKNSFYLAVTLDAPIMEWLALFAHQVKVGSRGSIEAIVASALTGVSMVHVQRPPNKLPTKSGYEYFYIEPRGFFWDQIKAEKNLSLFVSETFSKARIELLTIEEDD